MDGLDEKKSHVALFAHVALTWCHYGIHMLHYWELERPCFCVTLEKNKPKLGMFFQILACFSCFNYDGF